MSRHERGIRAPFFTLFLLLLYPQVARRKLYLICLLVMECQEQEQEQQQQSSMAADSVLARSTPSRRCRNNSLGLAMMIVMMMGIGAGVVIVVSLLRLDSDEPTASWRDSRSEPPRIALCFFGLTRSLRYTLPSVRARLLDVLLQDGFEVDIFVHTYHLREV